ncbi:hypothetical protein HNY73_006110 [Argiope bruennichi]|uniref:Uncharacterized protein n=1 Tax=Argiope bruennichi TaxID=94029 RepID=A0A8T0FIV8_ARGBR|nr:hypothetical protein HNY73_006110 [Argiope bruennichi]
MNTKSDSGAGPPLEHTQHKRRACIRQPSPQEPNRTLEGQSDAQLTRCHELEPNEDVRRRKETKPHYTIRAEPQTKPTGPRPQECGDRSQVTPVHPRWARLHERTETRIRPRRPTSITANPTERAGDKAYISAAPSEGPPYSGQRTPPGSWLANLAPNPRGSADTSRPSGRGATDPSKRSRTSNPVPAGTASLNAATTATLPRPDDATPAQGSTSNVEGRNTQKRRGARDPPDRKHPKRQRRETPPESRSLPTPKRCPQYESFFNKYMLDLYTTFY